MIDPAVPVEGDKKGGGRTPYEQKNNIYTRNTAYVLNALSEGVCDGLWDKANPEKSVYFDKVPLMSEEGNWNFEGVEVEERFGYADQSWISGFEEVAETIEVNADIEHSNPTPNPAIFVYTMSAGQEVDYVDITLSLPNGLVEVTGEGDIVSATCRWKISRWNYKTSVYDILIDGTDTGSNESSSPGVIHGKQTAPLSFTTRIPAYDYINLMPHERPTQVKVKVERAMADETSSKIQNKLTLASYTPVRKRKMQYADTALVGMTVDSFLFGDTIKKLLFKYNGIHILVPDNYDPVTRRYTGSWTGAFERKFCDNPAWVLYDILVNDRYGLGSTLPPDFINKWKLYSMAQYNDAVVAGTLTNDIGDMIYTNDDGNVVGGVPDGYGGLQPRFTFNGTINTRAEAYDVIKMIAGTMASQIYWGSGAVEFTQDSPSDPVAIFTPSNIIGGMINRAGGSLRQKFTTCVMKFRDGENFGDVTHEVVEGRDISTVESQQEKTFTAFGCNNRGQAIRTARRLLELERYGELITFSTGLDASRVRPGDLVYLKDPTHVQNVPLSPAGGDEASRIKLVQGGLYHTITVDSNVPFSSSEVYELVVMQPDGTLERMSIVNPNGTTDSFDLVGLLAQTPNQGAVFVIQASSLPMEQVRVTSVMPKENNTFEITGITHDPNKYTNIDTGSFIPIPSTSNYPNRSELPAPIGLEVAEHLYRAGPTVKSKAVLSWNPGMYEGATDPRVTKYDVQYRNPLSQQSLWEPVPNDSQTSSTQVELVDTQYGVYHFRVRARSNTFEISPWSATLSSNLESLTLPPDNVASLTGYPTGETMNLQWPAVTNLDLDHYEIRFASEVAGAGSWADSQILSSSVPKEATLFTVPARDGTYLIKAVDQQGDYSEVAASLVSTMASMFDFSVAHTHEEDNAQWTGTHSGTVQLEDSSENPPPTPPTLLGTYSLYLEGGIVMDGWGVMDSVVTLKGGTNYESAGTYDFVKLSGKDATVDLLAVYQSRLTYDMVLTSLNKNNVMSSWTSLSGLSNMAGAVEGETEVTLQVSTTSDDPTTGSGAVWSPWETLIINNYQARAFRFRILLASTNSDVTPVVSSCDIIIDMPDRTLTNNAVEVSTGSASKTVTYPSGAFIGPASPNFPSVFINAHNLQAGEYWTITSQSVSSFDIEFFDNTGTSLASTRNFDWVAKGYGRVIT